ncbi:MAG: methyltransferase domain-containing protein [Anaerolineae bacterium]|nr:methyltransferase domain-containing protein [Anaerolineae bacterium]
MNHTDHVNLLRAGIPARGGVWADFGSGTGAFTLALAELVGPEATLYSVDQDQRALTQQQRALRDHFPTVNVHYLNADFTRPLDLPPLDGLVMANSLHFHRHKAPILQRVRDYLKPAGRLLLVEYNTDHGNTWVPYPLSYPAWETLARETGFVETRKLAARPSRFLDEIYSAMSIRPADRGSP